jgi:murein DD-endopeptidase MepM/ murein hydrolase activator NlpD
MLALAVAIFGSIGAVLLNWEPNRGEQGLQNSQSPAATWTEYLAILNSQPLAESRISARWRDAAEDAVRHALPIEPPYREAVSIGEDEEWAIGLRVGLRRGQDLVLSVEGTGAEVGETLFVDLLEVDRRYGGFGTPVYGSRTHTTGSGEAFRFTAPRDGEFLVRLQTQPLRPVAFTLEAQVAPAYVFPVEGASPRDIWSVFGDSRGGGRRIHHGIDIFAPRGTILRAATDAYVARVGSRSLGGKIVTLYDQRRDIYLYYAHLEEWLVEEGSYVRAGDPVGRVGNTGNARYTPPHLHIGLYDGWWSRPIDPWNFFVSSEESRSVGKELALAVLGERRELGAGVQARVYVDGVPIVETLSVDREVRVIGVSEEGARVVLEDGIPAIVSPEQLR